MRRIFKGWLENPKDFLALLLVATYCLCFLATALIPGIEFDELMSRQYERIMIMVVGFYFGSHKTPARSCPDCPLKGTSD